MDLQLQKITRTADHPPTLRFSIEALYGWEGRTCRDLIQITYHPIKREAFLTVKIMNPGAGIIASRIIEVITAAGCFDSSIGSPPLKILETLADKLSLHYDRDLAEAELSGII